MLKPALRGAISKVGGRLGKLSFDLMEGCLVCCINWSVLSVARVMNAFVWLSQERVYQNQATVVNVIGLWWVACLWGICCML